MIGTCNEFLRSYFGNGDKGEGLVLEAGGGSFSHFVIPEGYRLIALDISLGQLQKNAATALKVQGDVHSVPLAANSVDCVVCFNVIEHLLDPEKALAGMLEALKPGGILILGCPNRSSLKGLITWLTPVSVHRWYFRVIVDKVDRGDGHYDVFPTPFRSLVADGPLKRWLLARKASLLFHKAYDGAHAFGITRGSLKRRLASFPYYALCFVGEMLTLGRWHARLSDILLIAQKDREAGA